MEGDADLKERIANHERSFEGMMSLIPADMYYGRDNSDQWQRKKQTKEEKRAAKMAKLQPGAAKSALDVHKENQLKRKRDEEGDELEQSSSAATSKSAKDSKKQKKGHNSDTIAQEDDESRRLAKAEKRKAKRQEKTARKAKKKEKQAAKKAARSDESQNANSKAASSKSNSHTTEADDEQDGEQEDDLAPLDVSGLEAEEVDEDGEESSASESSEDESGPFDDATNASSASSSSSVVPSVNDPQPQLSSKQPASTLKVPLSIDTDVAEQPEEENEEEEDWEDEQPEEAEQSSKQPKQQPSAKKQKALNLPNVDTATLQARLADKLAAFRAARHADGLDGRPARSRAELIDARRRKEEQRKAHKKELRAKARLAKDAEEEAARLRGGSGSPLWSPGNLPSMRKEDEENRFSFGRVAFDDGAELDATLSNVRDARAKKGPQDSKTALAAAQKKASRLAGYDADKRADIADKDSWLNASKRTHGEKVRDDAGLLKKSVKRQDKLKSKSEKAWQGRLDAVRQGKEAKQRRRDENLAKRRDEKKRGKKKGAGGSVRYGIQFGGVTKNVGGGGGAGKAKKRPGFEGTFKGSRGSRV